MTSKIVVAFQGEPGAYSEAATFELCGEGVQPLPLDSFELCYQAVDSGKADFAMLPIENNRGGTVIDNVDLQLRYNVHIVAELGFRVRHCLMALPGTTMKDIKTVISHPQALAQCDGFLRRHGYVPKKEYDTAGSAKKILEEKLVGFAAIASKLAAKHYDLEILQEGIEDDSSNTTRFLLMSKESLVAGSGAEPTAVKRIQKDMKTSLVFCVEDVTGSLFKALAAFSLRGVTLTKLESRPDCFRKTGTFLLPEMQSSGLYLGMPVNPELAPAEFAAVFYAEFLGSVYDYPVANAIKNLSEMAPFLRILGSYPTNGRLLPFLANKFSSRTTPEKKPAVPTKRKLRVGIVGFGNFGQFLAKTFVKHATVLACSRTDYTSLATAMGVRYFRDAKSMLADEGGLDVLVISVAILAFEKVVNTLPLNALTNVLVVDVLSVKTFAKLELLNKMPSATGILCTHPMFGPESGKYSWKGLPMVYDKVRITEAASYDGLYSQEEICDQFLEIFRAESCCMVEMDCESHDRQAADSQFITHFIGRVIAKLNLAPTGIATKGFKALLTLRDNTMKDSFDLFSALYLYNPNSSTSLNNISLAVSELATQLQQIEQDKIQGISGATTMDSERLSNFVKAVKPSKTSETFGLAVELKRQGKDILSTLAVGEPDFPPPKEILDSAAKALTVGETRYTPVPGTFDLRNAISQDLAKRKNVTADPLKEIIVTPGGKQAIFLAILSLCDKGDEVVIPAPYWVSYPEIVRMSKATPVFVQTEPQTDFILTPTQLSAVLSPSTRMIIICNPSNPTGALMERKHLEAIASLLRQPEYAHIYVLADEIYERLSYDGKEHVSFASLEGMENRTLTVNGFSKAFAMTGFRLGYLVAPAYVIKAANTLQGQMNSSPCSVSQYAGIAALSVKQEVLDPLYKGLEEKRNYVLSRLNSMKDVNCPTVSGAFYAFPDVSAYFGSNVKSKHDQTAIMGSADLCKYLIEHYGLALPPGSAFGGPYGVRMSYATSMEDLKEAMDRFERGLNDLIVT